MPEHKHINGVGGRAGLPVVWHMTLFELILVVGLIALLLSATTPSLRRFTHARKTLEEARRFVAATRSAGSRAVNRGEIVDLWVFPSEGIYSIVPSTKSSDGNADVTEFTVPDPLLMMLEIDSSAALEDSFCIRWFPDGTYEAEGLTAVTFWSRATPDDQAVIAPDAYGVRFQIGRRDTL